MITTKIYENENNDLHAVVYENGLYQNYVPDPEIAALEGEGFFAEAQLGFPEAFVYEDDFKFSDPYEMESVLKEKELRGCVLVAEVSDSIRLYPHRMSNQQREFFAIELGDDVIEDALASDTDGTGVVIEL